MPANATPQLKHVDPHRRRGRIYRAYAAFVGSSAGAWVSTRVAWKVDPHLMKWTRSRFGTGMLLPTALLETRGARSGQTRRNAVIYFHDGQRATIIASKLGASQHPAWYHNLVGDPEVTFGGVPMRAEVIEDPTERHRLWTLADRVYPPYEKYRREADRVGRTIPIVQLTPR